MVRRWMQHAGIVSFLALAGCSEGGGTAPLATADAMTGAPDGSAPDATSTGAPDADPAPDQGTTPTPDSGLALDSGTTPPTDGGAPADAGPTSGLDLTGAWAARVINSQCFDGGLVGKDTVQLTTLFLVQLVQSGTQVSTMTTACSVQLTPFGGNQTTYPQAAISAIQTPAQMSRLSAAQIGATYTPDERVSLLGWRAAQGQDPRTAAVPEEERDARLVDGDNDGHPGVTLTVSGRLNGDIYIANRNIVNIEGTVVTADLIEGRSHTVQIQRIIDSTNPLLGLSTIEATPNPDAASSTYHLVRLPAGTTSCAQIIAQAATLFSAPRPVTPCPM